MMLNYQHDIFIRFLTALINELMKYANGEYYFRTFRYI